MWKLKILLILSIFLATSPSYAKEKEIKVLLLMDSKIRVFVKDFSYDDIKISNKKDIWSDNETEFSYIYIPNNTKIEIGENIILAKDKKLYLNNKIINVPSLIIGKEYIRLGGFMLEGDKKNENN